MRYKIYLVGLLLVALFIPPLACKIGTAKKRAVFVSGFFWLVGLIIFFTLFAGVGLTLIALATLVAWYYLLVYSKRREDFYEC